MIWTLTALAFKDFAWPRYVFNICRLARGLRLLTDTNQEFEQRTAGVRWCTLACLASNMDMHWYSYSAWVGPRDFPETTASGGLCWNGQARTH
jgi:hypothetical protein